VKLMANRILLVDDDENILQGYTRVLRKAFDFQTAQGGHDALELLARSDPFSVIVADMRMPGMDGVELLAKVKEAYPDIIRVMLTGNADQGTAIDAVNKGAIFRFLSKPCDSEVLAATLHDALRQHQLLIAEKELLEQTLKGAIGMVVELLGLMDPVSFGRARNLADLAEKVAVQMKMDDAWVLGVSSVLSQIGILTLPAPLVSKLRSGSFLSGSERDIAQRVPEIGSNLIRHIPRLEKVAMAILYMNKNFNGSGFPLDALHGTEIPLAARVLRVANDYLNLSAAGKDSNQAISEMEQRKAWYDHEVVEALAQVLDLSQQSEAQGTILQLSLRELAAGQLLLEGVTTVDGLLIIPEGTLLGATHLEKLHNFSRLGGIREPIAVLIY